MAAGRNLAHAAACIVLAAGANAADAPEGVEAPAAVLQLAVLPAAPRAGEVATARLSLTPPPGWTLARTTPLHVAVAASGPWRPQRDALSAVDAQPSGDRGLQVAVTLAAEAAGPASVAMRAAYFLCAGRRCLRAGDERRAEVTIGAAVGTLPPGSLRP